MHTPIKIIGLAYLMGWGKKSDLPSFNIQELVAAEWRRLNHEQL